MNILNDNKQLQPNVFLGNLFDFQGQNWPKKIIFCFKSPKISNVSYNQKNFRQLFMIQSLLSVHEIFHKSLPLDIWLRGNNQISGSCNYKHIFVPKFELLRLLTKCIKKKKKKKSWTQVLPAETLCQRGRMG